MKICNNCSKSHLLYNKNIDNCPVCGSKLDYIYEKNKMSEINIYVDFTYIECDCGEMFLYECSKCPNCGNAHEIYQDDIDPKSKLRQIRFADILNIIKDSDLELRDLKISINERKVKKDFRDDVFDIIQVKFEEINKLNEKNIYKNKNFNSDKLESKSVEKNINEIKLTIKSIYNIYKELILIEVPYTWKNIFYRFQEVVKKYLNTNKLIIEAIISDNYTDTMEGMKLAQSYLDSTTEELNIFSDMLEVKRIEETTNKEFGIFDLIRLVRSRDLDSTYKYDEFTRLQENSYEYFKEFLEKDIGYYRELEFQILSNLFSYKVLVISSFLEIRFKPKIRNVIKVLELAKEKDLYKLKESMNNFKEKYLYALNIISDVSEIDEFNIKYYNKERLLVRNTMRSYKDFIEGVYRDIMTIILASSYILDKKDFEYEELKRLSFSEKLNYIENKIPKRKNKNLNLPILSGGINKIFRHAEAHVDYDIDNKNKSIILRNKKDENGSIIQEKYTFEEFYMLYIELKETIYSIIIGLEIFIANNYEEFSDFILDVNQNIVNDYEGYLFEFYFDTIGLRCIELNVYSENENSVLCIKCISEEYTGIDILEKCVYGLAGDAMQKNISEDIVIIEIVDLDNITIGFTEINMRYLNEYFEVEENLKSYQMVLIHLMVKISHNHGNYANKKDERYVLGLILKLIEDLKESIDDKEFEQILAELEYTYYIINEYQKSVLLEDSLILASIKLAIQDIINKKEKIQGYRDKECLKESIEEFYNNLLNIFYKKDNIKKQNKSKKVGRNEICPCGSGKKYKKCCGK